MLPGQMELLIVLILIIVLFGGKKIPELARSMGKAKLEYKKGMDEADAAEEEEEGVEVKPKKKTTAKKEPTSAESEKPAAE